MLGRNFPGLIYLLDVMLFKRQSILVGILFVVQLHTNLAVNVGSCVVAVASLRLHFVIVVWQVMA